MPYPLKSRIHLLNTFLPDTFVKREDELMLGMSGCKVRKIHGLLPTVDRKVVAWGGANSNFLTALAQIFNEREIDYLFYIRKAYHEALSGRVLRLMAGERLVELERSAWKEVATLAATHKEALILPEGGVCLPCLEGAKSLADDLQRNEVEAGPFKNVYIDAGTGLTAIALILRALELGRPWHIHVLLLAEGKEAFETCLRRYAKKLPDNYTLYTSGRRFAPLPLSRQKKALELSRSEGILFDPLYSAPLFLHCKEAVLPSSVIIHSGTGLNLLL